MISKEVLDSIFSKREESLWDQMYEERVRYLEGYRLTLQFDFSRFDMLHQRLIEISMIKAMIQKARSIPSETTRQQPE